MKPTDDFYQFPENGISTTPRTDAASNGYYTDIKNVARQLETELTAMTARAEKAEAELAAMTTCAKKLNEECELWEIRCGSIICSGVLDSYTGADLRKWEDEFKKKRGDLIARAEKAEAALQKILNVMREDSNGKDPMDAVEDIIIATKEASK